MAIRQPTTALQRAETRGRAANERRASVEQIRRRIRKRGQQEDIWKRSTGLKECDRNDKPVARDTGAVGVSLHAEFANLSASTISRNIRFEVIDAVFGQHGIDPHFDVGEFTALIQPDKSDGSTVFCG